jgi:hypothetical protein
VADEPDAHVSRRAASHAIDIGRMLSPQEAQAFFVRFKRAARKLTRPARAGERASARPKDSRRQAI